MNTNHLGGGLLAALLVTGLAPAPALGKPEACLGTGKRQRIVDNTLVGVMNPEGFEDQLRLAWCFPLITTPGLLYDYTQVEVGFTNYLGPVYDHLGVYASIDPLSFLQLRADVQGVAYWPLPFIDGAGYYQVAGYGSRYSDDVLPKELARGTGGVNVTLQATLRGAVSLGRRLELIVVDNFAGDYWYIGDGAYYPNLRRDVVLARSDWVIKNTAFLMLGIKASEQVEVRVGVADDLTWVPSSGYLGNITGGWLAVLMRRPGRLREIEPFVRVGGYTHHAFRLGMEGGFQLFGGLSLAWAWPGAASTSATEVARDRVGRPLAAR